MRCFLQVILPTDLQHPNTKQKRHTLPKINILYIDTTKMTPNLKPEIYFPGPSLLRCFHDKNATEGAAKDHSKSDLNSRLFFFWLRFVAWKKVTHKQQLRLENIGVQHFLQIEGLRSCGETGEGHQIPPPNPTSPSVQLYKWSNFGVMKYWEAKNDGSKTCV